MLRKSPATSNHLALVAILVVLASCMQATLARPQLTFSSSSSEDTFGHLTERKHNALKTVAGQRQSGFVRQTERSESASRAAKPTEAVLLFDGPLKGLAEIPIVKELSALLLPRFEEVLKNLNGASKGSGLKVTVNKLPEQGDYEKEKDSQEVNKKAQEFGHLLSDVGKVVFGSKSDGSDGLFTDEKVGVSKLLQDVGSALPHKDFGNALSSVGKLIDHVKPLNTFNQLGGGLLKGARSSQEPPTDFNRLLEDALAGESDEQSTRLFQGLNALLEEGVFLGKKSQSKCQHAQKPRQQQQQQQQEELAQQEDQEDDRQS